MITVEQIREAVKTHKIERWVLRRCSICNHQLYYSFIENVVVFSPACNCTTYHSPPEVRSWEDIAECFNIQSSDAVRDRMWAEFIASGSV